MRAPTTEERLSTIGASAVTATTLGGNSWDAAGPIWYSTLCDPHLSSSASFTEHEVEPHAGRSK